MACDSDAVRVLVLRRHHPVRIPVLVLPSLLARGRAEWLPRRMNVLIAIMADSYEMVKEHEIIEALHERAKIIVDMELLCECILRAGVSLCNDFDIWNVYLL